MRRKERERKIVKLVFAPTDLTIDFFPVFTSAGEIRVPKILVF